MIDHPLTELAELLDRPIAFHRAFVQFAGVTGALLLSQAVYWSRRTSDPDGWFWKTAEEWEGETGLSRHEQDTARGKLRAFSFWQEAKRGMPAKLYFRLDHGALLEALLARKGGAASKDAGNRQPRAPETGKHVSRDPEGMSPETRQPSQIRSETTARTTPETTAEIRARARGDRFAPKTWEKEVARQVGILVDAAGGRLFCLRDDAGRVRVINNVLHDALRRLEEHAPTDEQLELAGKVLSGGEFWMVRGRKGISIEWLFAKRQDHFGELLNFALNGQQREDSDDVIGDIG